MEYQTLSTHEQTLHRAVMAGDSEVVRSLLQARDELKINVNSKNPEALDSTAIHVAAKAGHKDLCVYLMTAGACPYFRNRMGETPASLAREAGHDELADFLRSSERNPPKMVEEFLPLYLAVEEEQEAA